MKKVLSALTAVALSAGLAQAASVESLVGDMDGFNGAVGINRVLLDGSRQMAAGNMGADAADEAAYTDGDFFLEVSGATYNHAIDLPVDFVITSVNYEIVTYDNTSKADGNGYRSNGKLFFDGTELRNGSGDAFFADAVGEWRDGFEYGLAEVFTADIDSSLWGSLLDGEVVIDYTGLEGAEDQVAVDYSRILIEGYTAQIGGTDLPDNDEPVNVNPAHAPTPAALGGGLLLLAGMIARRQRKTR